MSVDSVRRDADFVTELLTPAQTIYNEGAQIARRFEGQLQQSIEEFYRVSIPFAYRVKNERPWKSKEFEYLDSDDPSISLLKFLRASFGEKSSQKTAYQQATVLSMIIEDDLTYEDVQGIWFRYLLKLSYGFNLLSRNARAELLDVARTCKNIREFDAAVESAKRGVQIEPKTQKFLTASKSAIQKLNEFDQATNEAGDTRPEAEKLADFAGAALYTDLNFQTETVSRRVLGAYCRYMRKREPDLADESDTYILAEIIFRVMEMNSDDFDEESLAELEEIKKMRTSAIASVQNPV